MNQDVTTAFVTTVLNNVFTPYFNRVRKLEDRAGAMACKLLVPPKMRKRMNKLPDNYFTRTASVRFMLKHAAPDDGLHRNATYRLIMKKSVVLPGFVMDGAASAIDDEGLKRRMAKFVAIDKAYYSDRVRLQLQLRNLCAQCQSNRALIKAWPEAEGHIAGTATAPRGAGIVQHVQEMYVQVTRACKNASQKQEDKT